MSKTNDSEFGIRSVSSNHLAPELQTYKVDAGILKAILPEDVYRYWKYICEAIGASPALMFGCEYFFSVFLCVLFYKAKNLTCLFSFYFYFRGGGVGRAF